MKKIIPLLIFFAAFTLFGCIGPYPTEVAKGITECKEKPEVEYLQTDVSSFPRADCLTKLAGLHNDSSICEEINFSLRTGDVRDDCYDFVAVYNLDPSRCRQGRGASYGDCIAAASNYNETYCETLSDAEARDGCYFTVGSCTPARKGKCSLCSRIVNESYRGWCERYCEQFC